MVLFLPKGALINVDGTDLSDHNRSPAELTYENIRRGGQRIITGSLKTKNITAKKSLNISWESLPALDSQTVDGKSGRNTLRELADSLWLDSFSPVTLSYKEVDSTNAQVQVTMEVLLGEYSDELVKRFQKQLWNVRMVFVEV